VFERFAAHFALLPAHQAAGVPWRDPRLTSAAGYSELAERVAGCTFENGLYRMHDAQTGPRSSALVAEAFPEFAARACPFAYDWLGSQFALDSGHFEDGEALVLILEPGTGEALEVPLSFAAFHEQLHDYREPALAAEFFSAWAQANPSRVPLQANECVGYRVPLFLGGKDTVDNLEAGDLEVYWSLCGQMRQSTRHLPPGTQIGAFSMSE
jgi:hypothetical protein